MNRSKELNCAYRQLTGMNDGIISSIHWLEKYLKENPNDIKITEIYELLFDADKKANQAFTMLDLIMTEETDK